VVCRHWLFRYRRNNSVVVVVASVDWNLSEEEMWCCYNVDFQEVQLHSLEVEGLEDHLIPSKQ